MKYDVKQILRFRIWTIILSFFYCPQTKLRKGNVFTGVCDSVHRGGVPGPGEEPGSRGSGPGGAWSWGFWLGGAWWRPPWTATAVGGTYPTGMHSSLFLFFKDLCIFIADKADMEGNCPGDTAEVHDAWSYLLLVKITCLNLRKSLHLIRWIDCAVGSHFQSFAKCNRSPKWYQNDWILQSPLGGSHSF